ncbi:MAG: hypothetical protein ACLR8P_18800 [Clostridium fessum]
MENALDACRECTDSAPFIRICAHGGCQSHRDRR